LQKLTASANNITTHHLTAKKEKEILSRIWMIYLGWKPLGGCPCRRRENPEAGMMAQLTRTPASGAAIAYLTSGLL
jgi:hypothetical protein